MKLLDEQHILLNAKASTAEEAIREAGRQLLQAEDVEERYIDKMVASYRENGPYFVIAPNIAMPHARPEDGVKRAALSMVRLQDAVSFGHPKNDPVKLVFGLAASSSEEHLQFLQRLSQLLMDQNHVQTLLNASMSDILRLF